MKKKKSVSDDTAAESMEVEQKATITDARYFFKIMKPNMITMSYGVLNFQARQV